MKNKEVYRLMILTISPLISVIYKSIKNARKIWFSVKERFEGEIKDYEFYFYSSPDYKKLIAKQQTETLPR